MPALRPSLYKIARTSKDTPIETWLAPHAACGPVSVCARAVRRGATGKASASSPLLSPRLFRRLLRPFAGLRNQKVVSLPALPFMRRKPPGRRASSAPGLACFGIAILRLGLPATPFLSAIDGDPPDFRVISTERGELFFEEVRPSAKDHTDFVPQFHKGGDGH